MLNDVHVKNQVAEVKEKAIEGDDEVAHILEDKLHIDVLEAIASGSGNAQELAKEALRTREVKFMRWYA